MDHKSKLKNIFVQENIEKNLQKLRGKDLLVMTPKVYNPLKKKINN